MEDLAILCTDDQEGYEPRAKHGTRTGYNRGCRAEGCREANRIHIRNLRERLKEEKGFDEIPHGTRNGYVNYGCKCEKCKGANRR